MADNQTHLCSTQTEWISSCGCVEEPPAQSPGRGQLTSCPPQLLSPTASTGPDALRFPNQVDNYFFNTQKTGHAQETPNDSQHSHMSPGTEMGTVQKKLTGRSNYADRVLSNPCDRGPYRHNEPVLLGSDPADSEDVGCHEALRANQSRVSRSSNEGNNYPDYRSYFRVQEGNKNLFSL